MRSKIQEIVNSKIGSRGGQAQAQNRYGMKLAQETENIKIFDYNLYDSKQLIQHIKELTDLLYSERANLSNSNATMKDQIEKESRDILNKLDSQSKIQIIS